MAHYVVGMVCVILRSANVVVIMITVAKHVVVSIFARKIVAARLMDIVIKRLDVAIAGARGQVRTV